MTAKPKLILDNQEFFPLGLTLHKNNMDKYLLNAMQTGVTLQVYNANKDKEDILVNLISKEAVCSIHQN